jgi:1-acyl-sn-glycerol-3-phosphate acyltransferase
MTLKKSLANGLLKLMGWELVGQSPNIPQYVFVAAPHTSNWDFIYMSLCAAALGIKVHWIGKKSLFHGPLGWLLKAMGGIPIDRSKSTNMVDKLAELFQQYSTLHLGIPPEGTRRKTTFWKTGFYYIAHKAKVPIVCGFIDFKLKKLGLGPVFTPTGNIAEDFKFLAKFYEPFQAKIPHNKSDVRLKDTKE